MGLYIERYISFMEDRRDEEEAHWARWRVIVADFRNANRDPKKGRRVRPEDLIELSFDRDRKAEYHEIDLDEMKRRFGSKIKKKKNGQ